MPKPRKPELSVVLPIYNEEKSITALIKEYKIFGRNYRFELVCVDNGSTDETGKKLHTIAKKIKFIKVVTVKKNKGYGHGILAGLKKTSGEIVAWTHADLQTHPFDVFRAFEEYKIFGRRDIIIKGTRYGRPFTDSIVSLSMGIISSLLLRTRLSEINAQPKLFHRSFLPHLAKAPHDFSLDLFCLYKAKKLGYSIHTIPVLFYKRKHGTSKWSYSLHSRLNMMKKTFWYIYSLTRKSP